MSGLQRAAWTLVVMWLLIAVAAGGQKAVANAIDLQRLFEPPHLGALLGRDDLGRPLAARIAVGAQLSLTIALTVVAISGLAGTFIGIVAAWFGGWLDALVARIIDVFMAFPGVLLAIALSGILGPGISNVVIALCVVGWVGFARLARAQTLAVRQRDHVAVAAALGTPPLVAMRRHVLPLIAGPLIVEASFGVAAVIVAEAGLSFLGLGVQPPAPSWGSLIRDGMRYMLIAPHLVLIPGLALMSMVVAVNLIGDQLRDLWQAESR